MIHIKSKSATEARKLALTLAGGKAIRQTNSYKVPDGSGFRTYEYLIVG